MSRRDHVFLLSLPNTKLGLTFCKCDGYNKVQARVETEYVLEKVKGFKCYSLNYLGILSYEEMDPDIKDQLDHFEKHDPVWLLI